MLSWQNKYYIENPKVTLKSCISECQSQDLPWCLVNYLNISACALRCDSLVLTARGTEEA